jgi:hypothetical protein
MPLPGTEGSPRCMPQRPHLAQYPITGGIFRAKPLASTLRAQAQAVAFDREFLERDLVHDEASTVRINFSAGE